MIYTGNCVQDYHVQSNIQKQNFHLSAYCLHIWGRNSSVLYLQRTFVGTEILDPYESKL